MYLNTVFKYNVFKYCPALVIVYRLIDAALIGNYFGHPFLFSNRNSGQMLLLGHAMQQRVK